MSYSIAIDGPAGAGKGTIAKLIAQKLDFKYIDTGAMYRTVAYKVLKSGGNTKNVDDILSAIKDINMEIKFDENGQVMYLDNENVCTFIRTKEASIGASDVSVLPEVRIKLVEIQRKLAESQNVIMEGRDIGSYVLPNANLKIYLTASIEERAKRRYKEMIEKGFNPSFEEVKKDIEYRDNQDMNRQFAPLVKVDDAVEVDTSNMSINEVVDRIIDLYNSRK